LLARLVQEQEVLPQVVVQELEQEVLLQVAAVELAEQVVLLQVVALVLAEPLQEAAQELEECLLQKDLMNLLSHLIFS
tara:strand:- start:104 stop:337 length:234 start_codon:yes stop_codon:yes gene_type:complete